LKCGLRPGFVNASSGCLAINPNGCMGGVTQGCDYARVEGWNNMGHSTGAVSYGPLCFDNVPPDTKLIPDGTLAGAVYTTPVSVSFIATDATSGVKTTCSSIDGGAYSVYSGCYSTVSVWWETTLSTA